MKKYCFIIVFCASLCVGENTSWQNLKDYGLAHCLATFHIGEPSRDILASRAAYMQILNRAELLSRKALREYIERTIPNMLIHNFGLLEAPYDDMTLYFLSCMNMYHSQEYDNLIKELLKQYEEG